MADYLEENGHPCSTNVLCVKCPPRQHLWNKAINDMDRGNITIKEVIEYKAVRLIKHQTEINLLISVWCPICCSISQSCLGFKRFTLSYQLTKVGRISTVGLNLKTPKKRGMQINVN